MSVREFNEEKIDDQKATRGEATTRMNEKQQNEFYSCVG